MTVMINKDDFLLWLENEKQRMEQVEIDNVINVINRFLQERINKTDVLNEYRIRYRTKLDEYYQNDGKRAYELAKSLQAQGLSYKSIAHELTLTGIPTANGRTKWDGGTLHKMMKHLSNQAK